MREREEAWEMERERRGLRGLMSRVGGSSDDEADGLIEEFSAMGVGF